MVCTAWRRALHYASREPRRHDIRDARDDGMGRCTDPARNRAGAVAGRGARHDRRSAGLGRARGRGTMVCARDDQDDVQAGRLRPPVGAWRAYQRSMAVRRGLYLTRRSSRGRSMHRTYTLVALAGTVSSPSSSTGQPRRDAEDGRHDPRRRQPRRPTTKLRITRPI
jgi:hypothetical protein